MATSSTRIVIYAALIGNSLIAITKFIAAYITSSSAMFSEGIHSLVDTGNQVLLLYGIKRSQKPPDEKFPFGHGKEIYFWSFVVAILIFAVGAGVSVYEGIHRIYEPEPIKNIHINYIVLSLAILFESIAWMLAVKEFRHTKGKWGFIEGVKRAKDPSVFVILFEDTAAMLGLIIALLANIIAHQTGLVIFDGIASILIGLILAGTAIWLAHETKGLLIGESANLHVVKGIKELTRSIEEIDHVNEVLTMHMGPKFILVNISVGFKSYLSTGEIETVIRRLDAAIKREYTNVKRVFVEAENRTEISHTK